MNPVLMTVVATRRPHLAPGQNAFQQQGEINNGGNTEVDA
jgi:hypothetical protein